MKIKQILYLLLGIFITACGKDEAPTPTDEKFDKGHEEWDRVSMIFTQMSSGKTQEIHFQSERGTPVRSTQEPIEWKAGEKYHLELIYYNSKNKRMNGEFVTDEQVRIHQHFFLLGTYNYENKRFKPLAPKEEGVAKMNEIFSYTYQDTVPEEGKWGEEGVKPRLRFWDKTNPTALDPIGLKGVFHIKEGALGKYDMRIVLAHFLSRSKLDDKDNERKFNMLPYSTFFASDINLYIPIEIKK